MSGHSASGNAEGEIKEGEESAAMFTSGTADCDDLQEESHTDIIAAKSKDR